MKIYCDTSTLRNNIKPTEPKSQNELIALNELDKRYSLFVSHIVGSEIEKTKNAAQRDYLIIDFKGLNRVSKDERLLGFNAYGDRHGFYCTPIISDVQDEELRKELIDHGLEARDAEHIVQAVCNDCDVFLTRDERTIIKPHRQWLSQRFPKVKVLLPSELLEIIRRAETMT